jgi:hypothetical protein
MVFIIGGKAMTVPSILAFFALVAMVIFYAFDDRSQLVPSGFSAASVVAASVSSFRAVGHLGS